MILLHSATELAENPQVCKFTYRMCQVNPVGTVVIVIIQLLLVVVAVVAVAARCFVFSPFEVPGTSACIFQL